MANQTSGLFETLVVPAATASIQALRYSKAYPESIYWDYKDVGGRTGQTLNCDVPIVVEADATDIGSGSVSTSDTTHTTVPIVLDQHPSVSFTIQSWDEVRTPQDLQRLYVQPKLESLLRKINATVAAKAVAANFDVHDGITGGTATFTRANILAAWAKLAGAGVPVSDPGNLFFITHPAAYANMLADTNFYQESIVGINSAELAQRRAVFAPQANTVIKFDQQAPLSTTKYTGLFFHRYAIGGVVVRPPALSAAGKGGDGIKETVLYPFRNAPQFPVQLQMQSTVKEQGTLIHMHAMFGVKVVRPDHGVVLTAA